MSWSVASAESRDSKLIAALTAAQLYYMQDKTMEVIAKELGTRGPRSRVF